MNANGSPKIPQWLPPVASIGGIILLVLHLTKIIILDSISLVLIGMIGAVWVLPFIQRLKVGDFEVELKRIEEVQQSLAEINAEPPLSFGHTVGFQKFRRWKLDEEDSRRERKQGESFFSKRDKEVKEKTKWIFETDIATVEGSDKYSDETRFVVREKQQLYLGGKEGSAEDQKDPEHEQRGATRERPLGTASEGDVSQRILEALAHSGFSLRTAIGLARECELSEETVFGELEKLTLSDLVVKVPGKHGRILWGISSTGRLVVFS